MHRKKHLTFAVHIVYIPTFPVVGSTKIPVFGAVNVNITKSMPIMSKIESAALGYLQDSFSLLSFDAS